ncbi:helix-turn-helix domain-containing protein [Bacillus thuringiensis]|uniref:helix-turn-helix domain-containing protein n=1 Tax=Bacillus thuringiensis TaxID=1428 RepID=UPI002FFFB1BA
MEFHRKSIFSLMGMWLYPISINLINWLFSKTKKMSLDQGKTKQEIADFLNVDRTTIYRTLKRNGC